MLYVHHTAEALGGAPKSLETLLRTIDRSRFEAAVLLPEDGPVAELFRATDVPVQMDPRIRRFGGVTSPLNAPWRVLREFRLGRRTTAALREHVAALRPDIVHLNSSSLCMAARGVKLEAPHVPVVCHIRETLARGLAGILIRQLNHRYCQAFVGIDADGLARARTDGRLTVVIPNSVDTSVFAATPRQTSFREALGLRADDVLALFLGRFTPLNGILEAVRMIRQLPLDLRHVHFCFMGYTPTPASATRSRGTGRRVPRLRDLKRRLMPTYLSRIEAAAETAGNIHLRPFQVDILTALAGTDIMFCPFTVPHFARCIVEAAAMGIPAIAADIPSVRRLVDPGHTGLLFDPASGTSLVHALRKLTSTEYRARLGAQARVHAAQHFDSGRNMLALQAFYEQL